MKGGNRGEGEKWGAVCSPDQRAAMLLHPHTNRTTGWSDFKLKQTNQMVRLRLTRPFLQCGLGRTGNTVFKIQRRAA